MKSYKKRKSLDKKIKIEILARFFNGEKINSIFNNTNLQDELEKSNDKKYGSKLISAWIKKMNFNKDNIEEFNKNLNLQKIAYNNNFTDCIDEKFNNQD